MTSSPDPFGGTPFGQAAGGPPILTSGPPRPAAPNTLATLSVVFAFVFAPIGAVLGHLGLAQIERTGQPGRSRAVIGIATSYALIAIAVVAVAIWTVTGSAGRPVAPTSAAELKSPAAAPLGPPAGPHVSPAGLAALLPNATQMGALTLDFNLSLHATVTQLEVGQGEGVVDRSECEGLVVVGDARVYDTTAVRGMYLTDYLDRKNGFALEAVQAVSAYDDAAAAQAALSTLLAGWRACGDHFALNFNGKILQQRVSVPIDDGHGLTMTSVSTTNAPLFTSRAIAAKANVIVDVIVGTTTQFVTAPAVIARAILDKIPG